MQPNHAVLTLRCAHADLDGLSTTLWDRGTLGLQEIELPGGLYEIQAYFDAPFDANDLPGFVGWHEQPVAGETDWQAAWQVSSARISPSMNLKLDQRTSPTACIT